MLIRTSYTATDVTVTLYGNNGGRRVEAVAGEPFDFVKPRTVYRPDPAVPPGAQVRHQAGADGFTIRVTRVIRFPDGTEKRSVATTSYDPADEIILHNPATPPVVVPASPS